MSVSGTYKITINTPMGQQTPNLTLKEENGSVSGTFDSPMGGAQEFSGGTVEGNTAKFDITRRLRDYFEGLDASWAA